MFCVLNILALEHKAVTCDSYYQRLSRLSSYVGMHGMDVQ